VDRIAPRPARPFGQTDVYRQKELLLLSDHLTSFVARPPHVHPETLNCYAK
jgi:hypothetical protein